MGTTGPFPAYSRHNSMTIGYVEMVSNGAANPTAVVDEGNILSRDTPPAYVAVGILRLTLRERWRGIAAIVTKNDNAQQVMASAVTDGSTVTNVVDILTHVATVAAVPTAAANLVKVTFILYR
jgi:hypothetical protein